MKAPPVGIFERSAAVPHEPVTEFWLVNQPARDRRSAAEVGEALRRWLDQLEPGILVNDHYLRHELKANHAAFGRAVRSPGLREYRVVTREGDRYWGERRTVHDYLQKQIQADLEAAVRLGRQQPGRQVRA